MDKRWKWYAGGRYYIAFLSEIKYARIDCVVMLKSEQNKHFLFKCFKYLFDIWNIFVIFLSI